MWGHSNIRSIYAGVADERVTREEIMLLFGESQARQAGQPGLLSSLWYSNATLQISLAAGEGPRCRWIELPAIWRQSPYPRP